MKTYKRIEKLEEAVSFACEDISKKDCALSCVVADIGTDHGYLAEKLSKLDHIGKVIASDISEKSLSKLQKLIKNRNLTKIETVVGDGLEPIEKADVSVIAGIGGWEIIKILKTQNRTSDGKTKCDYFVLQPAQNVVELRTWLFSNKIRVISDYVIEDAERFYPIIIVNVSEKQSNRKDIYNLWLGRDCWRYPEDFRLFLKEIKESFTFLKDISKERAKEDKVLYQKYRLNKLIDKLLKEYENIDSWREWDYVRKYIKVSRDWRCFDCWRKWTFEV